jgi:hypothetical protein
MDIEHIVDREITQGNRYCIDNPIDYVQSSVLPKLNGQANSSYVVVIAAVKDSTGLYIAVQHGSKRDFTQKNFPLLNGLNPPKELRDLDNYVEQAVKFVVTEARRGYSSVVFVSGQDIADIVRTKVEELRIYQQVPSHLPEEIVSATMLEPAT